MNGTLKNSLWMTGVLAGLVVLVVAGTGCGPSVTYRPIDYGGYVEPGMPVGRQIELGSEEAGPGSAVTVTVLGRKKVEIKEANSKQKFYRLRVRYDFLNNFDAPLVFHRQDSRIIGLPQGDYKEIPEGDTATQLVPKEGPATFEVPAKEFRSIEVFSDAAPGLNQDQLDSLTVQLACTIPGGPYLVEARFVRVTRDSYPSYDPYYEPYYPYGGRSRSRFTFGAGTAFH